MERQRKIVIGLPGALLDEIDFIAENEFRCRTDLVREALRRYADEFRSKHSTGDNVIPLKRASE